MIGKHINKYCSEDITLIENYDKAINDTTQTWHCHHRLEIELNKSIKELINLGLYYNRPACELIFLTKYEHRKLHYNPLINKTEEQIKEWKENISKSLKGKCFIDAMTEEQIKEWKGNISKSLKGKKHSEVHNKKISESCKGRKLSDEHMQKLNNYFKMHGSNIKGKHKVWDNKELKIYHYE